MTEHGDTHTHHNINLQILKKNKKSTCKYYCYIYMRTKIKLKALIPSFLLPQYFSQIDAIIFFTYNRG